MEGLRRLALLTLLSAALGMQNGGACLVWGYRRSAGWGFLIAGWNVDFLLISDRNLP